MPDALQKMTSLVAWIVPIIILGSIVVPQAIRILREYQRGVIFRLGKLLRAKGPGLIFLIPYVDRMVRMDLRVGHVHGDVEGLHHAALGRLVPAAQRAPQRGYASGHPAY